MEWDVRRDATWLLGNLLPDTEALHRLTALLEDEDTAVEQEAAEVLVRRGDSYGLLAVLANLGARVEDPDADYIAYRLRELQLFEQIPVLQLARQYADKYPSGPIHEGIRQLEDLFGAEVAPDG
ncbi:HEAT repeat domain-containing protein [Nocardia donostiensis]|uniref:HEAT repeat domain-containing protein n=2 Tax=Nocardia donostiensis TaxID=1538463 RepID=A0A1W0B3B8_9NOCA|nr:HEAT repeat domain-containing protein [Nocardia donostiensis]ONM48711.1 hypothetical protein B0T46_11840 [Nocardia donostiensis]OQS16901.1 hypothetical protein B0T36_04515 [Nocardia donostiensis]OQS17777.1 hypothetical protein B0T44_23125 [Nocardia donostiensis]